MDIFYLIIHWLGNSKSICYVTLKNGNVYPAEVIWGDENHDISIIKIAAENLLALSLGDSDKISLGEQVYCLSNSTGYNFSEKINQGIISKLSVTQKINEENIIKYAEDIIKIDIDIKSDNSGGAILNCDGELLGVASSKLNAVIPINRIKKIIDILKTEGEFEEAYLGIYGFGNNALKYLDLDYISNIGVYIEKIDEDSPVYNKVLSGDIITKIDDFELSSMQELSQYLYTKKPKEQVTLHVIRGTKEFDINCVLANKK